MNEEYDLLIIGTGLTESILSTSLPSSTSILQIDPNPIYGSINQSTLSLSQLIHYFSSKSTSPTINQRFTNISTTYSTQIKSRSNSPQFKYNFNLIPSLLYTQSKLIHHFIQTGSSNSLSFQLLNSFSYLGFHEDGQRQRSWVDLPASKHDLFKSDLSLIHKRKLVKLFQWVLDQEENGNGTAKVDDRMNDDSNRTDHPHQSQSSSRHPNPSEPNASDHQDQSPSEQTLTDETESLHTFLHTKPYEFPPSLISQLSALSLSPFHSQKTSSAKSFQRIRTTINSIGRYGSTHGPASSFLITQYGGIGEWIESLIRASAISNQAVQILGRKIRKLEKVEGGWNVKVEEIEEGFFVKRLVLGVDHLSVLEDRAMDRKISHAIHRAILVVRLEDLGWEMEKVDPKHALVVIEDENGRDPIHVLIIGSSSESCPDGEVIVYLSTLSKPSSSNETSQEILDPIITHLILKPHNKDPLMKVFYTQLVFHHLLPQPSTPNRLILENWPEDCEDAGLGRLFDWSVEYVEEVIRKEF